MVPRKTGNCGGSREILQAGEGLSLEVKEKLRHKAQLLLSVCCVLHVASSQQVFEQQYLLIDLGWFCSVVSAFALFCMGSFTAVALLHIHTCAGHVRRSVLKGGILRMFFKSL